MSVLANWMAEINRWCPELRATLFYGNVKQRQRQFQEILAGLCDVVVTNYESFKQSTNTERERQTKILRDKWWRLIVVDEAHRIKNDESLAAVGLSAIHAHFKLLLTGTPLQNDLHELWALLHFLFPTVFDSAEPFDQAYDPTNKRVDMELLPKVSELLLPVMLRRIKHGTQVISDIDFVDRSSSFQDVELTLPPKVETKIFVPMSKMQHMWYRGFLEEDPSVFRFFISTYRNLI